MMSQRILRVDEFERYRGDFRKEVDVVLKRRFDGAERTVALERQLPESKHKVTVFITESR